MAKYIVKHTSILHNGKVYAEGKTINLKEEDALRLSDFLECVSETTETNKNKDSEATGKSETNEKSESNSSSKKVKADTGDEDGE